MKKLVLCGVAALSLVGGMLIAHRDKDVRYDRETGEPYTGSRGLVVGAAHGVGDTISGAGKVIGRIFGGGRNYKEGRKIEYQRRSNKIEGYKGPLKDR